MRGLWWPDSFSKATRRHHEAVVRVRKQLRQEGIDIPYSAIPRTVNRAFLSAFARGVRAGIAGDDECPYRDLRTDR